MKAPGGETHRALFVFLLALALAGWGVGAPSRATTCGDGAIQDPEPCDDGNTVTGDGCSFPSCLPEECGDSIVNPDPPSGEECDDGNSVSGDGCDANCTIECGNGNLDSGEDCDTSGESATCDDDCTFPECGDTNVNEFDGEACDDGNTVQCDGCSNCFIELCTPLTRNSQSCINAVNKSLAGVIRAQNADTESCLAGIAAGTLQPACIGSDAKERVAKAQARTAATFAGKRCTGPNRPNFAFTSAAAVNEAGELPVLGSTEVVFGPTPNLVLKSSDKAGAACQAEVLKRHDAVLAAWIGAANREKKAALKGKNDPLVPPVASNAELAAAIDAALAADPLVAKAEAKLAAGIEKRCTDEQIGVLFDCNVAATRAQLAACVRTSAERAACEAIEGADGLGLDCPVLPVP